MRQTGIVFFGLYFNAREGRANAFCFDDAGGLAIQIQHIVRGFAAGQWKLTNGNSPMGGQILLPDITHVPTRRHQQPVDFFARLTFIPLG